MARLRTEADLQPPPIYLELRTVGPPRKHGWYLFVGNSAGPVAQARAEFHERMKAVGQLKPSARKTLPADLQATIFRPSLLRRWQQALNGHIRGRG